MTLVVSSGPEQVAVPNVVGQSEDEARATLEAAGFKVGDSDQETDDEDPGTVLAQNPARGPRRQGLDGHAHGRQGAAKVAVPDVTGEKPGRRGATR